MQLTISDEIINNLPYVKLQISDDFNNEAWDLIKGSIKKIQNSNFKDETNSMIVAEWFSLLQILPDLKSFRNVYKFEVNYSEYAKKFIRDAIENSKTAALGVSDIDIGEDINHKLRNLGFDKITLEKYQIRDLKRLCSIPHGANFSVQGSGKTAVSIALHLLLREKQEANSLIVVSPKNAFLAWQEDGFDDLLNENSELRNEGLTELKGGFDKIQETLNSGKRNFIINYEKLVNCTSLIGHFVLNPKNKVHVILDESHKIKSEDAQRTEAAQALSTLPFVRKEILSGTPLPNKKEDINTQYKFLYPYSEYNGNSFFVRTTKKELNIPTPTRKFITVEMSDTQLALYSLVLGNLMKQVEGITSIDKSNFRDVRKSIIRLIMISTNPILLTTRMIENGEFYFGDNISSKIHLELQKELSEGGSPKIKTACDMARKLAEEGKKTVIWSYFRNNIEFIGKYALKDLHAEYIHGGVNIGSEDEFDTRKYKIKKFKDITSECKVLVANYASCAEGISLHHACHDAIYIDRSFQADQYLQSEDRISRLGNNTPKNIYILQSAIPRNLRNIDYAIKINLQRKIDEMGAFLNDERLIQMAIDETEGDLPIDNNTSVENIKNIFADLMNSNEA